MPFRLNEYRAKIQFTTFARMPYLIYQACLATDTISNTVYCQIALCEKLSRDLGIPVEDLLAECPTPRSRAAHVFEKPVPLDQKLHGGVARIGPANTNEEVK